MNTDHVARRPAHKLPLRERMRRHLAVWRSVDPVAAEAARVHQLAPEQRERYLRRRGIDRY